MPTMTLEGGVWTLADAGGGNEMVVPVGGLTLSSTDGTIDIDLSNSGDTPAAIEVSFASNYLKGVSPDQGDAVTPSWVVDPDVGSRTVQFERGAVAVPVTDPPSASTEVVTFTGNAGVISTVNIPTSALGGLAELVATKNPTFMFKYAGDFSNSGTEGGTATSTDGTNPLTAVTSSEVTGLTGYVETTGTTDRVHMMEGGGYYMLNSKVDCSTDRTCVMVWSTGGSITSTMIAYAYWRDHFPLHLQGTDSSAYYTARSSGSGSSLVNKYMTSGGGGVHTVGGVTIEPLTCQINTTYIVAMSYDLSEQEMTIRWKKTSGVAGHNYQVLSRSPGTSSGSAYGGWYIVNAPSGYSHAQRPVKHRFMSIFNSIITETEFTTFAASIGL